MNELKSLMTSVCEIAREAGEKIMGIYNTADFNVEIKADDSPLTSADLAAHQHIVKKLTALTPDIPILSEESAKIPWETRQTWTRYWLIDPLDGTKEFIKRNGEFTVNIALIDQHYPLMGVVYAPVKQWLYYACQGEGSWKTTPENDAPTRLQVLSNLQKPLIVAGSRSHGSSADMQTFMQKLELQFGTYKLMSMGSSLKLCLVAEGKADLYPRIGLTSEWDTAASQAVVEYAGGKVVAIDQQRLSYNQKESLLNPYFYVYGCDELTVVF